MDIIRISWKYPRSVDIIHISFIYPYFVEIIRILWKYPRSVDIIRISSVPYLTLYLSSKSDWCTRDKYYTEMYNTIIDYNDHNDTKLLNENILESIHKVIEEESNANNLTADTFSRTSNT